MPESLEPLDERIAAAMAQDQLPVIAAARAAAEAQTPSTLREAIVTAREVGSLGSVPPMVPVVDGGNFWVRVDTTEAGVKVQLGRRRQPPCAPWIEMTDDDTEGRLIEFGQQLQS